MLQCRHDGYDVDKDNVFEAKKLQIHGGYTTTGIQFNNTFIVDVKGGCIGVATVEVEESQRSMNFTRTREQSVTVVPTFVGKHLHSSSPMDPSNSPFFSSILTIEKKMGESTANIKDRKIEKNKAGFQKFGDFCFPR